MTITGTINWLAFAMALTAFYIGARSHSGFIKFCFFTMGAIWIAMAFMGKAQKLL